MSILKQFESKQGQGASQEALAPMRTLTTEELVEIVGGPEIQNGGSAGAAVSAVTISS